MIGNRIVNLQRENREERVILDKQGRRVKGKNLPYSRRSEREREEKTFQNVIIKRNDEAIKHPDDILENAIHEGIEQLNRPLLSLFISSISGGLLIGFSALAAATAASAFYSLENELFRRMMIALFYPIGFVFCIMGGSQLFTEQTATIVYPVIDRKAKFFDMLKVWVTTIFGNLIGAVLVSLLLFSTLPITGIEAGFLLLSEHLIHFDFFLLFLSAVMAGWLMATGSWLILATPPMSAQIICIFLVTFTIGIAGFHHSIAGSVEVFVGYLLTEKIASIDVVSFILTALSGNLVGGSVFVALLNYAHVRKTQY